MRQSKLMKMLSTEWKSQFYFYGFLNIYRFWAILLHEWHLGLNHTAKNKRDFPKFVKTFDLTKHNRLSWFHCVDIM